MGRGEEERREARRPGRLRKPGMLKGGRAGGCAGKACGEEATSVSEYQASSSAVQPFSQPAEPREISVAAPGPLRCCASMKRCNYPSRSCAAVPAVPRVAVQLCLAPAATSVNGRPRPPLGDRGQEPGDDLLSHSSGAALPSATAGLTIVFGMGTCVSPRP